MILAGSIECTEPTTEKGSHTNWEQLQMTVKRYCLSITGSSWDAEDLAQDTWLKARPILQETGHANPEAYLLRIAKNTWIDQLRRSRSLSFILKQEQSMTVMPDHGALEMETAFLALIKHMSALQRTVFLLRDVLGYSIIETAQMLHTTEGAIKAALHRARQSLGAVRSDLEQGVLALPEAESSKALLRMLVAAYQLGDIAVLVELAQRDQLEPAVAIGIARNHLNSKRTSASKRYGKLHTQPAHNIGMAA
ncbi:RNA polymerase sigma-70 factor, ECF subfamily [Paenibacillus sp. 1_12]|uniref:sigma-70 family RNA polymerase sigma factor n=1 Tax=Paenibacillus sp. 1_12 TaxID=1566278 RepID=UPI0008DF0BEF|nr:RNA polymerase sigma factor [Paenibacillus sp. 1_12]SFL60026.1 RNA polymerase sigma-70 factor, ECF subfamily [Paenibacillus sp. 1_12]